MPHILTSGEPLRPARPDRAILLGAALLVTDLSCLAPEFDLVAVAEANPWATIAAARPTHQGILTAWRRHGPLRDLVVVDGPVASWESGLRQSLSASGPPEPKEVVAYISAACPNPTFGRALLTELQGYSRPARSSRHTAFTRHGTLTAKGWMGLYTVIRFLCLPGVLPLGDAAMRLGIGLPTLQGRCRRTLALDCRDARKGFGWKWAVERALRLHGYIPDSPRLQLGIRISYPVRPSRADPEGRISA